MKVYIAPVVEVMEYEVENVYLATSTTPNNLQINSDYEDVDQL